MQCHCSFALTLTASHSAKMYKTRFKQWGFVKNNNREDVAKMMLLRQRRAAVGKQTTFERNGKVVQIDRYLKKRGIIVPQQNTPIGHNELPGTVRCRTPPPLPAPELFSTTPGLLSLKELLMKCLKDLMPSFANLRDSTYVRYKATTSLWDSPRYLKLACNLFSEKRHKQAGSICDSAFSSVHALVQPPRLDTLFNFLVSQLWWNNKDVTLELWRYLAAYMASVLGATGSAVYHLLRGLVTHIESNGYGAYLDFVTECIDDVLRLDGSDQTKPRFCWKGENQLVGWCQLIVMDCYFTNGYNPRADRIQARCASALPRSRSKSRYFVFLFQSENATWALCVATQGSCHSFPESFVNSRFSIQSFLETATSTKECGATHLTLVPRHHRSHCLLRRAHATTASFVSPLRAMPRFSDRRLDRQ